MRTLFRVLATSCVAGLTALSCSGVPSPSGAAREVDASAGVAPLSTAVTVAATSASTPDSAALRSAAIRVQQKAPGYDFAGDGTGGFLTHAGTHGSGVDVRSEGTGVHVTSDATVAPAAAFELAVTTTGIGRSGGGPGSSEVLERHADGQELVLTRDHGVEERYLAGPLGLEQSYTLATRPGGQGSLVIQVELQGLTPRLAAGATDRVELLDAAGHMKTGYSDLSAVDAAGTALAASMQVKDGSISLVIDDALAQYPVRVDPLVWTQQAELTSSDGGAGDWFGASVSMSGNLAIVGAPNHTVGGATEAGAAYVFVLNGGTWTLQQELTAGDAAAFDSFGTSVAVSGTVAVVGAPFHTVGGKTEAGVAYVFVQSGTTWSEGQELTASDGASFDELGTSVALSGSTAVVGGPFHEANGHSQAGAAYVFAASGTTFSQQQELTASDGKLADLFGYSVAVSGTTAVVGAYQHDVGATVSAGAAYVFVQAGTTWSQQAELTASDGAISDFFGYSVALNGATAIVGAYEHNVGGSVSAGTAYIFVQAGTVWGQQQELSASDAAASDFFGASVAVYGGTAVIGAYQHAVSGHADQGAAYTFIQSGTTWTQAQELTSSDGAASDQFGTAVAASGDSAVVGALGHTVGANGAEGSAYVFLGAITGGTGCYINGVLYASGAANPADACQACEPATSTTSFSNAPDGTSCGTGEVCTGGACEAGCYITGTFYPTGTVNPANACQVCTPASSTTTWSDTSNGGACNDGNACTQTDTCQAGVCTGSNPVVCTASDQCHTAGTCNPATGACSNPADPNGTTCNDGNACTQSDTCQAGVCTGSNPVTCTASDQCHTAGTCNPSTGACSNPQDPNGTACNDGNGCTQSDTCQAGVCTGSNPVTCTASDQCHTAGACNPSTGVCSNPQDPNGTTCNDGNACTQSDTCQAGVCTGSNPVTCTASDQCHTAGACNPSTGVCSNPQDPNGTTCNDGNACTQSDTCQAGVCTGSNPVTCTASDQCHTAGACNPSTGVCSNPQDPNGTTCNDGNACTQSDTCQAGVCTGSSPVVCTPSDQCHAAGTCNASTGACTNPSVPDGTACSDGVACQANDVCTAGVCAGTPYTCTPTVCQATSTCNGTGTCTTTNQGLGTTCTDDGNPCTLDECDGNGSCTHPNETNGTPCGSGSVCENGVCSASPVDAGENDGGSTGDGGSVKDGGGSSDSGTGDGSASDGGAHDGSTGDAGPGDSGAHDGSASNDGSTSDGATTSDGSSGGDSATGDGSAGDGATADSGSGEGDAGETDGAVDGGDGGDGGPNAGNSQSNGCGCRTAGASPNERSAGLLGALGLAFLGIRRRRRGGSR